METIDATEGFGLSYISSDCHGIIFVGPEGEGNAVWHEEALIEELGTRAWAALDIVGE